MSSEIIQTLWITTIRAVNSVTRLAITAYLIAESKEYGLTASIIAGYLLFSYRFLYQSVGLHATSKYKLRQVLQLSKLYLVLVVSMCVIGIGSGFIEYEYKETTRLILIILTLSLFCAYINELVRFSAKDLIRRNTFSILETIRITIEISIYVGLYYSYVHNTQPYIIPTIILSIIIINYSVLSLGRDKSRFAKRLTIFLRIKFDFKNMRESWKWYTFLLVSGLLFSLDRVFIAALHSNAIAYISAATFCLPLVGAISFLNIWTLRTKISLHRRLILAYLTLILSYIFIFILISYADLSDVASGYAYWIKFIDENYIFLLFLSILYLTRDFLSQLTFEISTDVSIYLISPAFLLFLFLASSNASWQYVLLLPAFTYTSLTLGYLAYAKSKSPIQHT